MSAVVNDSHIIFICDYKDDKLVCIDDKHFWKLKAVLAAEDTTR